MPLIASVDTFVGSALRTTICQSQPAEEASLVLSDEVSTDTAGNYGRLPCAPIVYRIQEPRIYRLL